MQKISAIPGFIAAICTIAVSTFATGCAGTKDAIESREIETSVKMSDTVFLEPVEPEQKIVYIDVRNTSDRPDLDPQTIQNIVAAKLEGRGYLVTDSPSSAHYRLQANILYADHEKKTLTEDGMLTGGLGGAVAGSRIGGDNTSRNVAGVVGAAAGAVLGGIAGSMVHVDKYLLVVDIQIAERTVGDVDTSATAESRQGSVSKTQSTMGASEFLNYQTRMVGSAKKTNLKWEEARPVLLDGFASSLAGIF